MQCFSDKDVVRDYSEDDESRGGHHLCLRSPIAEVSCASAGATVPTTILGIAREAA